MNLPSPLRALALAVSLLSLQLTALAIDHPATERYPSTAKSTAKVNVNTADAATLEQLPGIGATLAESIIAARPFATVDDLARVPGIGATKLKELRPNVTVGSLHPAAASEHHASAKPRSASTAEHKQATSTNSDRAPVAADSGASVRTPASTTPARDEHGRFVRSGAELHRINLNTASQAELESLPEIGPVKAQAIINARPFSKPEDVMRVSGIKQATYDAIKDQITVR